MEKIHDIYDRVAKRCISLSTRCTVNLINGLFGTNYPVDSKVTYNWTENTDDELRRTLSDTIITINGRYSYHIEFQMTEDGDIILRVLEYGFHHAMRNQSAINEIDFPEPLIIYLYDRESFPNKYTLRINFGSQGTFCYEVPVFKYLDYSLEELDRRKLIVLLPFQLLRLRRAIEKERTKENMEALKKLITHDILNSLNRNVDAGNITQIEAGKLSRMIMYLYNHIYEGYEELQGVTHMAEEALVFDVDILDYEIRKLTKKKQELEEETQVLIKSKQNLEKSKQDLEKSNQDLEKSKQELENLNINLIRMLASMYSPEEISAQTGISLEDIKSALREV